MSSKCGARYKAVWRYPDIIFRQPAVQLVYNSQMQLIINLPKKFNFYHAVTDYGWYQLKPFEWNEEKQILSTVLNLNKKIIRIHIAQFDKKSLQIEIEKVTKFSHTELAELNKIINRIFRLDEDFEEFFLFAKNHLEFNFITQQGRSRLIRSATLFEDIVKTILTTNTTWRQTKNMSESLCKLCGSKYSKDNYTFPTPLQIKNSKIEDLKNIARLGYRAEYIHNLASMIVDLKINLEDIESKIVDTKERYKFLRAIKGVGDYSANNILMLLGDYSNLAFDSEMRSHVTKKYFQGKIVSEKEIKNFYEKFGKFKYLFYWFDMTSN